MDSDAWASPRNLRLGALLLAFVAINQIEDPLVDATVGQEVLYWCVRFGVLAVGLWMGDALISRVAPSRWTHPPWLRPVVLVTALALVPYSVAEILIEPHLPLRPEFVDDDLWNVSPMLAWLSEYATALSIFVPAHLLLWLIVDHRMEQRSASDLAQDDPDCPDRPATANRGARSEVHVEADQTAQNVAGQARVTSSDLAQNGDAPLPEFLAQSDVTRIEDVLALQAQEHYVRVFTPDGSVLVHGRFSDASTAMPPRAGLRVHRSWWVADAAVCTAKRGARRWQLNLVTGDAVPVSDSYVRDVRERGLLKRRRNR